MNLHEQVQAGHYGLVAAESFESKHIEPVGMAIAREQFGRTFSNTFDAFASLKAVMVNEESQQLHIIIADMAAKEKVVPQTRVEILNNGTCSRRR